MIMKKISRQIITVLIWLSAAVLLSNCGSGAAGDTSRSYGGGTSGDEYNSGYSVTLSWDAPTTNEDGTPLTDLAGYKTYYGQSYGNYEHSINTESYNTIVIDNLSAGTWCFAVTAYDISGNESTYSDEVCVEI
jgi:hypothetical protein